MSLTEPKKIDEEKQIDDSSPSSGSEGTPDQNGSPPEAEGEWLSGIKMWLVFTSITLAFFLMLLDMSIISPAIPRITNQFNSLHDIGWYGSAYQISSACIQPLSGKIYTYYSSKWTFLAFFGIFELGSVICGAANSSTMLIVGRAIAGMGTAGIQNGGMTILAAAIPIQRLAALIGILFACAQLGIALGPIIGGALTEYATWRWCFYINLPLGALLAAGMAFIHLPDQIAKPPFKESLSRSFKELDLIGFVIFSGFTIQLLLALQWGGNEHAWNSATIIGLLCGSFGALAVFIFFNHRKGDGALIPVSMVANRVVWSTVLSLMGLMGVVICNAYFLPIYFQAVMDKTPLQSGVAYLPSVISQLVSVFISGWIINQVGYYLPVAIFSMVLCCLGNGLGSLLSPTTPQPDWIGYQIPMGAGRGPSMQVVFVAMQHALPKHQISLGQSLLAFGQAIGASLGLAIGNVIFDTSLRSGLQSFAPSVDSDHIIETGATAFRSFVSAADLPGVLKAFSQAIDHVYYLSTGLSVATFFVIWAIGWGNVKAKKE